MTLITGMSISGKMSIAMRASTNGVASTIIIAMTMKVYGRRSASPTTDSESLASACMQPPGGYSRALFGLDSGGPGDPGETGDFALDVGGELLGRARRHVQPLGAERRAHVLARQHLDHLGVQALDDR